MPAAVGAAATGMVAPPAKLPLLALQALVAAVAQT